MRSKSRKEKEALFEWHLQRVLQPLGFSVGEPLPYEVRADRVWWFFRATKRFATEAVCIPLQWRAPAAFTVECFASALPVAELRTRGLRGSTAIGNTPYVYLVHRLDRPQAEVMGDIVELGREDSWSILFERLGAELSAIEPDFWNDLLHMWEQRIASEPESELT
jgi:hypothetical protein